MLIVSKFIDYYDRVGEQYGVDKSIVYQRKTIANPPEWKRKENPDMEVVSQKDMDQISSRLQSVFRYNSFGPNAGELEFPRVTERDEHRVWWMVNFCGQIHILLEIEIAGYQNGKEYISSHSIWLTEDKILETLQEEAKKPIKKAKWGRKGQNEWAESIAVIQKLKSLDYTQYMFERKIPVFAARITSSRWNNTEGHLILNPRLEDLEFWRVKDPFTAFQEIQQYISGVIGTGANEPVVTSDTYKIMAAGFDLKTSFRKDPGKPKPRKQKG